MKFISLNVDPTKDMVMSLADGGGDDPTPRTSEFDFTITSTLTQPLYLTQSTANAITVDWGDGSEPDNPSDLAASLSHEYAEAGNYTVKVTVAEGETWSPGATIAQVVYSLVGNNSTTEPNTTITKAVLRQGALLNQQGGFIGCAALASVVANDVQEIQAHTFSGCTALSAVTLGSGTTALYAYAFADCAAMMSLTCKAVVPPTCYSVTTLRDLPADCAIYVPAESVAAYQTASRWSARTAYIQAIPT